MAIESRDILKTYFETGKIPTEEQFDNLIDSYIHRIDDGVYVFLVPGVDEKRFGIGIKEPAHPLGIKVQGDDESLISFHGIKNEHLWTINLLPDGKVQRGYNIQQETFGGPVTRFFIDEITGNVGVGVAVPTEKLHIEESTPTGITGIKILNTASVGNQGWEIGHLQDPLTERDGSWLISESETERVIIRPGGNVGINEAVPDTKLHVSLPVSDPKAVISLVEGTGIVVIGPITDNIVADFQGIQARHGEYIGEVLNLQTSTLNLQALGGDILIHGDGTIANEQKTLLTSDSKLGLGTITPLEKLDVNGAIKISNTSNNNAGTIRWTGSDFEGRTASAWVSLTAGNGPWSVGSGNTIYYNNGNVPRIAVGTDLANATLTISDNENVTQGNTAASIENKSSTTSTGQDDNRIGLELKCSGNWGGDPLSKNIGLYISQVSGQSANEVNLSAVMNGNVVIGDLLAGGNVVGDGGARVLVIQPGSEPTTVPDQNAAQLFSKNLPGTAIPALHVMDGSGHIIKIYQESALSPSANMSAFPASYDGTVIDILNNMRERINALETKLQNFGLLA